MAKKKLIMEEIHQTGARLHPTRWLSANETAIHAAIRLGVDHTTEEHRTLLSLVALHILETFFNPKSTYTAVPAVRAVKLSADDDSVLSDKLRSLILMGCKQAGSFVPELALISVEEMMTCKEAELASAFLHWVTRHNEKFGHGNIDQVWADYQASLRKDKKA